MGREDEIEEKKKSFNKYLTEKWNWLQKMEGKLFFEFSRTVF